MPDAVRAVGICYHELCRDSAKYDINHDACQCLYLSTCRKSGLNTPQTQTATGFRRFSHETHTYQTLGRNGGGLSHFNTGKAQGKNARHYFISTLTTQGNRSN